MTGGVQLPDFLYQGIPIGAVGGPGQPFLAAGLFGCDLIFKRVGLGSTTLLHGLLATMPGGRRGVSKKRKQHTGGESSRPIK